MNSEMLDMVKGDLFEAPEKEKFEITDLSCADWALGKIKDTEKDYQRALVYLEEKENKIKQLKEKYKKKLDQETGFLIGKLKEWTEQELDGKKTRNIELTNGKVGLRKRPASVDVSDNIKALNFCQEENLKIKLEMSLESNYEDIRQLTDFFSTFENAKWKISVIKEEITDHFKQKKFDVAYFQGGVFNNGEDKFYIE
ncbi:host-nuclease inhibitor Gam family protein [Candidatus Woesearchaeota archaeon]|nr:host-nuclease inhibitor Gam family protein [Candidatus Woesearchaeota archaeon]